MLIAPNAKEAPTVVLKTQRVAVKCGPRNNALQVSPFQTHFSFRRTTGGQRITSQDTKDGVVNLSSLSS